MDEAARPATTADLPVVATLAAAARAELVGERGGPLWALVDDRPGTGPDVLATYLDAADRALFVGTLDDHVVGYALVHERPLRDGTTLAELTDVYVDPEARALGVGEALVAAVLAWAEAHGCRGLDAWALPGMRESKNLFERFGVKARRLVVHRPLGRWAAATGATTEDAGA